MRLDDVVIWKLCRHELIESKSMLILNCKKKM